MFKKYLQTYTTVLWNFLVDTLVPLDPCTRKLQKMSPQEFMTRARTPNLHQNTTSPIAYFSYKDPLVQKALLEVKSHGDKKIACTIGEAVYEHLRTTIKNTQISYTFESPLLVPVPMTKKSVRVRGWNQCELFIDEIAKKSHGLLEIHKDALIKIRETDDQVGKNRRERFKNLSFVFQANSSIVRDRNIIVLDDILTTGATLNDARRALVEAGAKRVLCVAIAH